MSVTVLLGPQRPAPLLLPFVDAIGAEGRVALVTAGWRERESEDAELRRHLGQRAVNLHLYQRAEAVFERDPELFTLHRASQRRLQEAHDLYRRRLDHQMGAIQELLARPRDTDIFAEVAEEAFELQRRLDRRHVARMAELRSAFEECEPREREALAEEIDAVDRLLGDCGTLLLAGGHVGVLLHRLRLFAVLDRWGDRPILAWSAGAMALAERVVLFHDSPPQGFGNAEVYDLGLGRVAGLQPLPDARRRLRLEDRARVEMLARRLEPTVGVPLDAGEHLVLGEWRGPAPPELRQLLPDGRVGRLEVA